MAGPELCWLPPAPDWGEAFGRVGADPTAAAWELLVSLANLRPDLVSTLRLDRRLQKLFGAVAPPGLATKPVRLAVLGSSTIDHLLPAIRVGALRRGLWASLYKTDYGQYSQELFTPGSALRAWKPNVALFALDARHLLGGIKASQAADEVTARLDRLTETIVACWREARSGLGCTVIQQTALPVLPRLFGNNEHRLPGSPAAFDRTG